MSVESSQYQRAILLLQQNRPKDAERELRQVLVDDPANAWAHSMLAQALVEQDRFDDAQYHASEGIGLAPDEPLVHYVMSLVMFARNRIPEAGQAIETAIQLDPNNGDYHAMLAQVLLQDQRWADAKRVAERGLALDPEHVACTNLRAMAMVHLGEKQQAGQTIDAALRRDPDNALSHANQGWTLLHQGQHVKAMEAFRESLRLDPTSEWARAGIVEALKAQHFVYRLMLRYFLFMSRMSRQVQWAVFIGLWLVSRVLEGIAQRSPEFRPFVMPIVWGYVAFAVMTWLSPHLFNLLLRVNQYGRHALSPDQRAASNWIGGVLLAALLALMVAATRWDGDFLVLGVTIFALALPLSGAMSCPRGWPRTVMYVVTVALAAVALSLFFVGMGAEPLQETRATAWRTLLYVFIAGVFAAQILANVLVGQRVTR